MKYQYWLNGVMMSLVDLETAKSIIIDAEKNGFKVYNNLNNGYFTVDTD